MAYEGGSESIDEVEPKLETAYEALIGYVAKDIDDCMEGGMTQDCPRRDKCRTLFGNFLKANISLIHDSRAAKEGISKNRAKLTEMKEKAPYGIKCGACFSEAFKLFDKEVSLMRFLQVVRNIDGK